MLVHLRRTAAVLATALVMLAAWTWAPVGVTPAEAFCGSLCSPNAPAVLAASEAMAAPVSAAGAAAASGTVSTAGVAAGVSGISFGTAAVNTAGVAAAVSLYGWSQGWFDVAPGGVQGVDRGEGAAAGYQPSAEFGLPLENGTGMRFKMGIVGGRTAEAYGTSNVPAIAVDATVTAFFGPATGPQAALTGQQLVAGYIYRTASGGVFFDYLPWTTLNPPGGWSIRKSDPSHTQTVTHTYAGRTLPESLNATFIGFIFQNATGSAPSECRSSPLNQSCIDARLSNGSAVVWLPESNPDAAPGTSPGQGVITQRMKCVGAGGAVQELSRQITVDISKSGRYDVPEFNCPNGMVPAEYGADFAPAKPTDPGTPTIPLVPSTQTPGWIQDIPAKYPECIGSSCVLELYEVRPDGAREYCGALAVACPDWYRTPLPQRGDQYECRWGPYVVTTDRCSVYRLPGSTLPNAEVKPDGSTSYDPWPPVPGPGDLPGTSPGGEPGESGEPSRCWPSGWGRFNPVQWVLMPVQCALQWAGETLVVPKTTPARLQQLTTTITTKTPVPEIGSVIGFFDPPEVSSRCWVVDLPFPQPLGTMRALDSCDRSNVVVRLLQDNRGLLTVIVWVEVLAPLAWWAWREYAPGAKGVA